ncbi:unnamed protein product [Prorocentrum cordatum]|uniref:Uncharacterized protein n=1 Tax=Prorocentrum cordatum TaxID=2364126 RepID=A0ABN9Q8E5_9DINO|nr:unnamed protein product [Polarella glacialis]
MLCPLCRPGNLSPPVPPPWGGHVAQHLPRTCQQPSIKALAAPEDGPRTAHQRADGPPARGAARRRERTVRSILLQDRGLGQSRLLGAPGGLQGHGAGRIADAWIDSARTPAWSELEHCFLQQELAC